MVYLGAKLKSEVLYVINDQDMIALVYINTPTSVMIYANKLLPTYTFKIKDDAVSRVTAMLITFTTLLCNKSDYFCGFEQVTSGTFLKSSCYPFQFSISAQAKSDEILPVNEQLIHSIIDSIKVENCKPQYRLNEQFTLLTCQYVRRVCMYLSLDIKFFC